MTKANLSSLLLLCLALSACGGSKSSGRSSNRLPVSETTQLSDLENKVTLDGDMPEGLGLLLRRSLSDIQTCTAFMVSETRVLTNSHCVTNVLADDCKDSLQFQIQTKQGKQIRSCKRILSKSSIEKGAISKPDFALIELSRPVSLSAKYQISREGFKDKEELVVQSVDTVIGEDLTIFGRYKESKCQTFAFSLAGNFSHNSSSIIPLFAASSDTDNLDCRLIPGNSGSPVLGKHGRVLGILYAGGTVDALPAGSQRQGKNLPYYLTTNLSCLTLKDKTLDALRNPECDQFLKDEANFRDLTLSKLGVKERITAEIERIMKKLPKTFQFELEQSSKGDNILISFKATCMHSPKTWSKDDQDQINKSLLGKKSYKVEVPFYTASAKVLFDSYMRATLEFAALEAGLVELHVPNLGKVKTDEPGELKIISYLMDKKVTKEIHIGLCATYDVSKTQ